MATDYGAQYRFKMATHGLWYENAEDKSLTPEEAVIIDKVHVCVSE